MSHTIASRPADQSGLTKPGTILSKMIPHTVESGMDTAPTLTAIDNDANNTTVPTKKVRRNLTLSGFRISAGSRDCAMAV
jgi:hypothetical protein